MADTFAPETKRQRFNRRAAAMKSDRSSFESHWRELSEHMLPFHGSWWAGDRNRGDKKHQKIIDATPLFAARVLASGMMAGLTSPARPWFRLTTPDADLAEFAAVKAWLDLVTQRMRDLLARSNLYNALPTIYAELGVFGTAACLALEDDDTRLRFYPQTIGSYWLAQSSRLKVDTLYREQQWTVRQVVQRFGIEACSPKVQSEFRRGAYESTVDICHLIEPNDEVLLGAQGGQGRLIRSIWWESACPEDKLLTEDGFYESPLLAPRWFVPGTDLYGKSPGMDALGDAKALQFQQKRKAQAIDKMVDPPLVGPTSLRNQRVSLLPGDVTYVDTQQVGAGLKSIFDVALNPSMLLEDTQAIQDRINTAFFADLFLMLLNDTRGTPPTAEEIRARQSEKMLMLGPVLERLNDELLSPIIDRTFGVMLRSGLVPPPPRELEGVDLKVDYISILAQAQKMVGLGGIDRLVMFVGNLAAAKQDPAVFDKLDSDQAVDDYGDMLGVSPKLIVPDDVVAAQRAERAKQAQMQQMAAMAQPMQQGAQAIKALSEAKADPDSVIAGLMGGAGAPA